MNLVRRDVGDFMNQPVATAMTREDYERDICSRSGASSRVTVKNDGGFGGWEPQVSDCHNNVDYWVEHHAGHTAVRGWIYYYGHEPEPVTYTAHSVVCGPDGKLFDITPLHNRSDKQRGRFIPHLGDEATFLAMRKDAFIILTCLGGLAALPVDPLCGYQDYTLPTDEGL